MICFVVHTCVVILFTINNVQDPTPVVNRVNIARIGNLGHGEESMETPLARPRSYANTRSTFVLHEVNMCPKRLTAGQKRGLTYWPLIGVCIIFMVTALKRILYNLTAYPCIDPNGFKRQPRSKLVN
jgi:hypothetical protein